MAIQHLKSINEQLVDAQLDYSVKKLLYKEKEAKLLLETDFEEVLGKKRPTVVYHLEQEARAVVGLFRNAGWLESRWVP